jgi:hypothetical protein
MKRIHKPTAAQQIILIFTASGALADMRVVTAAVFLARLRSSGETATLTAVKGTATANSVIFSHRLDPTAGELQDVGEYDIWGLLSTPAGPIESADIYSVRVVEDWETTT